MRIDGKTLRRSFDRACRSAAIHLVSVWASKAELVLSQKTNHTAGPDHAPRFRFFDSDIESLLAHRAG